MKKIIGFVDNYLSNWHANNYPAWIAEASKAMGVEFELKYAYALTEVCPVDGVTTDQWCEKFGVKRCDSARELCEKCDYVLILAPRDPELHLSLAREVLPYAKRVYIDKTFAPDLATAKAIFALAEENGAQIFSSSALRYATELQEAMGADSVRTTGGGRSIEEYVVHQAEMVIKAMDSDPVAVTVNAKDDGYESRIEMSDGRTAVMTFAPSLGFTLAYDRNGESNTLEVTSAFFPALIADILNFFLSGEVSFDPDQTLRVMKLREGVIKGKEALGTRVIL